MTVRPVTRQDRQFSKNGPGPGAEGLFASVAAAAAPRRFNSADSGRIAGSVAAQRTHEQALAAFGPDRTLVQKLPAFVSRVATETARRLRGGVPGTGLVLQ